jgi:hypothetical protein
VAPKGLGPLATKAAAKQKNRATGAKRFIALIATST